MKKLNNIIALSTIPCVNAISKYRRSFDTSLPAQNFEIGELKREEDKICRVARPRNSVGIHF